MNNEIRETSFEKNSTKTKNNDSKGKNRSGSLLFISSGMTFLAAIPQRSSGTTSSLRSSTYR